MPSKSLAAHIKEMEAAADKYESRTGLTDSWWHDRVAELKRLQRESRKATKTPKVETQETD